MSPDAVLGVWYSGEEATVTWTWNGGSLSERHQLGDGNKTLTVPSTDTGTFSVCVTNPVSNRSCSQYTAPPSGVQCDTENVVWVAVSSDLHVCGFTCEHLGIYTLDREPQDAILDFACSDQSMRMYGDYKERLS
ncbi:hypothetical protein GDO86_016514 [Hymenochirus boettgeri]|uniref:Ig-like domain-containing protein n=1 Tax=Hymenochirus boettgeri TaxID=247094 RepID=A0A8T2K3C6_9PIPI|nr:hypothetical protein GDO86_016514 [Hymenochirus boettgeri]